MLFLSLFDMIRVIFLNYLYCMLVCIMWSVVNSQFVEYAAVEDQGGFEQQHAWVEGKSLLHSLLSYYNMHFNYTIFTFCMH
jgi:hypothetical protein